MLGLRIVKAEVKIRNNRLGVCAMSRRVSKIYTKALNKIINLIKLKMKKNYQNLAQMNQDFVNVF